ncbi:MAG: prepilin-type N-terminal cleavage/methylation domain-containing protein [Planctomycetota bacterium]
MKPSPVQRAAQARSRGFSMIELVVVLLLLGLTSALAAASLRGTKTVFDNALLKQQLVDFDQRVRQRAQLGGDVREVTLDLDEANLREQAEGEAETSPLRWSTSEQHARVVAVWTPSTGWVQRGEVTWRCSGEAVMPTYALELSAAGDEERWLIAGVSGQWTLLDADGRRGEAILDALRVASDG